MSPQLSRRAILIALPGTLVLARGARAGLFTRPLPDGLDRSLTRLSERGLYRATLSPDVMPITTAQMHAWTVTLQTVAGVPVTRAGMRIGGGMPQHGHGLPTAPQMTKNLGDGRYLIEGVKFNMRGWWTFEIAIADAVGADVVIFNIVL